MLMVRRKGEKMELDNIMEKYGFKTSSSCSGFEWYAKRISYKGLDALVTITSDDEIHLPKSLDDPVLVSINDSNSGNELEAPQNFESLKSYLDTLNSVS